MTVLTYAAVIVTFLLLRPLIRRLELLTSWRGRFTLLLSVTVGLIAAVSWSIYNGVLQGIPIGILAFYVVAVASAYQWGLEVRPKSRKD